MRKLKVELNTTRGCRQCVLEIPKECDVLENGHRLREAVTRVYESLGAEVLSVGRIEEIVNEV